MGTRPVMTHTANVVCTTFVWIEDQIHEDSRFTAENVADRKP